MKGERGAAGLGAARAHLRRCLSERRAVLAPGAANALTARVIEDLGFEAVYVTGAGVANTHLGLPDIGLLTVTELNDVVVRISDVCSLPLIVDIDTGFGNAINVGRVIATLERAGASAVQIEDQVFPKKCGHFEGKAVISQQEMASKIKAAVDARHDPNLQIIARTDARAVEGLDRALERAEYYREAGADVIFVEAPLNLSELTLVGQLSAPQVVNIVIGGKTPEISQAELRRLGFSLALYANAALQASLRAMQETLGHLKAQGSLWGIEDALASFAERQRIVAKPDYDLLEERYKSADRSDAA
ncbi:2-methylisocitrate lyase-like PEP mutase family enzyme [Enterovirga rhinocerotis]|uniref:2-methylisocitrate lyase-like PEP mutase family enzyme n=2 Tax=Enterovirga rhinocerotis TaxID=1339210 RepID=A0A4R7C3A2_9HYPH|nr:2-methylisocitrate lyase-like PEP mutase family enzyme [Enterovirga rhinocerotis]